MKAVRLVACFAISATLLVSGCASGIATVTGTLVGSDGHCLYVDVPDASGPVRYWLRRVPSDYVTGVDSRIGRPDGGIGKPDGTVIEIGDTLTVSGSLSWVPFDRQCAGAHTLDATAIK